MIFRTCPLAGAFIIDLEPHTDERGFFARTWCQREFAAHGLSTRLAQCNISFNRRRGTVRGIHYQEYPHGEAKLIRCTRGRIFDVIVDVRTESPSYLRWTGVELSADSHRMLFVPEGLAHGFQTLEDDTEVLYQMSEYYDPDSARGLRWNDPILGVGWPLPDAIVSPRDSSFADIRRP